MQYFHKELEGRILLDQFPNGHVLQKIDRAKQSQVVLTGHGVKLTRTSPEDRGWSRYLLRAKIGEIYQTIQVDPLYFLISDKRERTTDPVFHPQDLEPTAIDFGDDPSRIKVHELTADELVLTDAPLSDIALIKACTYSEITLESLMIARLLWFSSVLGSYYSNLIEFFPTASPEQKRYLQLGANGFRQITKFTELDLRTGSYDPTGEIPVTRLIASSLKPTEVLPMTEGFYRDGNNLVVVATSPSVVYGKRATATVCNMKNLFICMESSCDTLCIEDAAHAESEGYAFVFGSSYLEKLPDFRQYLK